MPGIVPSDVAASARRRGGAVNQTKTATAATKAAVTSRSFFTSRDWGLGAGGYPARDVSTAALSVRSQVNSGSVRPKCPNAAVFL